MCVCGREACALRSSEHNCEAQDLKAVDNVKQFSPYHSRNNSGTPPQWNVKVLRSKLFTAKFQHSHLFPRQLAYDVRWNEGMIPLAEAGKYDFFLVVARAPCFR